MAREARRVITEGGRIKREEGTKERGWNTKDGPGMKEALVHTRGFRRGMAGRVCSRATGRDDVTFGKYLC